MKRYAVLAIMPFLFGCAQFIRDSGAGYGTGAQNPDTFLKCIDFDGTVNSQLDGVSPIISGRGSAMGRIRTFGVVSKGTWSPEAQATIASMCEPPQESITSTDGTVTIKQDDRKIEFKLGDGEF